MTKHILLLAALGLALTALSAQAQITIYKYDGDGNTTFAKSYREDGSTSTVRAAYDKHGNVTASQVDEEPAANPIAESAASTYRTHVEHARQQADPVRTVPIVQPDVIVVPVSAAEMHAASLAGAARVKAQNAAAIAATAHKKHGE
jgi:hypothetical protein